MAGKQVQPPRVTVNVEIDSKLYNDVREVEGEFGRLDTTLPSDAVINCKINGRRTYRFVMGDGSVYEGKGSYQWHEEVIDPERPDTATFLVTVETIDEWPNPCECCGASHDTLDCD